MRLWLIATIVLLAGTAQAAVVSDNFDASAPSPFWGFVTNGGGPTANHTGGRIEASVPNGSTGAGSIVGGLWSRCAVSGDFDMQTDYQLLGAQPNNGLLELFAWQFTGIPMGGVTRNFQAGTYGVFQSFGVPLGVSTSDTAGRFRLQRVGATVRGYYDSGGQWVQIGEVPFSTADARVGLIAVGSAAGPTISSAYDNFSLQATGITCPVLNELCGDGTVQTPGEQCDDGNAAGGDGCCDCKTGPFSPIPNVAGGWQRTVACPGQVSVVRSVDLDQTPGSSFVNVISPSCGTFFSDGEIHEICNAGSLLTAEPAQLCGTTFAFYPPAGEGFVSPLFSSALGSCSNVNRIIAQERFRGVVTTDGANNATRIAGPQGFDYLKMYNLGELTDPCYETYGAQCVFEMRRNSAPAGMNQSVEPLSGVTVTFLRTDTDTAVQVVPKSAPSTVLPPNFQVVANGSGALYLSIEPLSGSYAAGPGAITVCLSYPDTNPNDGIVDGTNPPVNENAIKILHDEGGTFVDRTSSRDAVGNKVCATVASFSQFLIGAGAAPTPSVLCGTTPRVDCRKPTKAGAASILVKRAKTGKSALTWKWKGAATTKAEFGDPLGTTDYQLCLYDRSAATVIPAITTTAPAGGSCGTTTCWTDKSTGFKYKDKEATPDGLFQLDLKEGVDGKASITLKGSGPELDVSLPLQSDPSVTVQLVSSTGLCWDADFSTAQKSDTGQFRAKSD